MTQARKRKEVKVRREITNEKQEKTLGGTCQNNETRARGDDGEMKTDMMKTELS